MSKRIPLSQGKFTLVSDEDYDRVAQYKWSYDKGYAVRMVKNGAHRRKILLHRFILDAPAGFDVDHANKHRLDNRRSNLRLADRSQNNANSGPRSGKYKGVHWKTRDRRWYASITVRGENLWIGSFTSAVDAALAYDAVARAAWGEFTYLNFPDVADRGNGDE